VGLGNHHTLTSALDANPRVRGTSASHARRRLADRAAGWIIRGGGLAIIVCILGILVFILHEVWPLLRAPRVVAARSFAARISPPAAVLTNEYRTHVAVIEADGTLVAYRIADGAQVLSEQVYPPSPDPGRPTLDLMRGYPALKMLAASTWDGKIVTAGVDWKADYEGETRTVTPSLAEPVLYDLEAGGSRVSAFAIHAGSDGDVVVAAALADRTLVLEQREVTQNFLTGESEATLSASRAVSPRMISSLEIADEGRQLYAGTPHGELVSWPIVNGAPGDPEIVSAGAKAITSICLLLGGRTLVVGAEDGSLGAWFSVRQLDESQELTHIRSFPSAPGAVKLVSASPRDRSFFVEDASGTLSLYHSTSDRLLWRGPSPEPGAVAIAYAPKGNGIVLAGAARVAEMDVANPHPEAGLGAYFGKVWYEGYQEPEYVWQSSSGTDDFEPKLSLVPLIFGTLKGTIYSLLLAIPLGVLGAMYTSQFMHPSVRRIVKPAVEIMAALPSVVIGFVAGLWLAPRLQDYIPALVLMVALVPMGVILAGYVWETYLKRRLGKVPAGAELLPMMAAAAAAMWIAAKAGPAFESLLFGESFPAWVRDALGLSYDQRNAVVIGIGMGFAVIPIIFSISEEAFSNVPRNLISGSLALGATRWQTVSRVVLPMASPGIFSAIMIGLGRAIGETMIVVMATGNTPIMEWNPFNGFRTLSANIAVEVPEAPNGGTLYRTLFLAAFLLFVMTFILNTAAEVVRMRLRRRHAGA